MSKYVHIDDRNSRPVLRLKTRAVFFLFGLLPARVAAVLTYVLFWRKPR